MNKPFGTVSLGGATGIPNAPQPDAQAEQVLTDRMASLGKLVAGLAHEMNNPLASVLANLELAQVDVGELIQNGSPAAQLETLQEELRNARDAAERVRQLLHDLRMFSRAEDEEPTPVDVADILDTSLRIARNAIRYRARIVKDYERVSPVLATETGLAQA
ncbi:MAG TPA: histidine kinase dimerization/phospho-acceptor domain-containing protein, partial [Polyangiaceae bacterium]|nr:histidine kinase dimerization/phospho-acceptor domain-containing protein [Polyangiaceae bacterium]